MKRSEMVKLLAGVFTKELGILQRYEGENLDNADETLRFLEANGMLPPNNTCKLVPHSDGTTKHSASERKWDSEE